MKAKWLILAGIAGAFAIAGGYYLSKSMTKNTCFCNDGCCGDDEDGLTPQAEEEASEEEVGGIEIMDELN